MSDLVKALSEIREFLTWLGSYAPSAWWVLAFGVSIVLAWKAPELLRVVLEHRRERRINDQKHAIELAKLDHRLKLAERKRGSVTKRGGP